MENEDIDVPHKEFSLQELLAHSAQVDANLAKERHEDEKGEAIAAFGLVDPTTKSGTKKAAATPPVVPTAPAAPINPFAA